MIIKKDLKDMFVEIYNNYISSRDKEDYFRYVNMKIEQIKEKKKRTYN